MAKFTRTTDETGKRYGHWLVLSLDGIRGNRESYWRVRCVCGKERSVRGSHLREGRSISCGCQTRSRIKEEETGKRYGHLLVLSAEVRENRRGYWRVRCDCGKESIVRGVRLRNGSTTNCGCLTKGGFPRRPLRPRRSEPCKGYASDAELTELILAWQKEEEPDLLLEIVRKLDPLTRFLFRREAEWHDAAARAELESDIFVKVRRACLRFRPGYSVYSYFRTVIHYAIVGYWSRYGEWINTFVSLDAPLGVNEEGEELTLYDVLSAPLIRGS